MASHFKTPDDGSVSGGTARHASVPSSGRGPAHVRPQHGGDESYHAPQANRHAASTPHSVSAHYIPVVSEPANGEKNKRDARFVETDPYDLSGRRSGDPKKRVGRIVSAVLFILGIALIVTAAGMWIYNQWQYHEQDVINEELATFADVSDDGQSIGIVVLRRIELQEFLADGREAAPLALGAVERRQSLPIPYIGAVLADCKPQMRLRRIHLPESEFGETEIVAHGVIGGEVPVQAGENLTGCGETLLGVIRHAAQELVGVGFLTAGEPAAGKKQRHDE